MCWESEGYRVLLGLPVGSLPSSMSSPSRGRLALISGHAHECTLLLLHRDTQGRGKPRKESSCFLSPDQPLQVARAGCVSAVKS